MSESESKLSPLAVKIIASVMSALAGALLMLLVNSGGDRRQVDMNSKRLDVIELQLKDLQTVYATNKRVDDLQAEVRTNYRDLSGKMDNVIKILLDRK